MRESKWFGLVDKMCGQAERGTCGACTFEEELACSGELLLGKELSAELKRAAAEACWKASPRTERARRTACSTNRSLVVFLPCR